MDLTTIAGYIGMALLGGLLGWFLSDVAINFVKWREKKNVLKNIEKQKIDSFYNPNKEEVTEKISLKQLVRLNPPLEDGIEADEEYNDYTRS